MLYFINGTRKGNLNSVEEISGYRVNTYKSSLGEYYSKKDFFSKHFGLLNIYYSYNPKTESSARLEKRISLNGEPYLQSVGNWLKSDNLLELPDC